MLLEDVPCFVINVILHICIDILNVFVVVDQQRDGPDELLTRFETVEHRYTGLIE